MKVASLALAAVIVSTSLAAPVFAAGKEAAISAPQTDEFSSARKKRDPSPFYRTIDPQTGEVITRYRPDYLVPSNDFEGGHYAGEYAWRRALGQCVEDLGYGRFKGC